ncbi:hypothetical protein ACQ4LE_006513 [Meloidogyne hapla]|uniref:Ubiquinol-cytochrome-c reductase complex assembly factor 2 n=1 Tax=Meloidogyne hapla TaxID=6305 RepID=A0A1I8C0P8_MELHA
MGSYLYKFYRRILINWPIDATKSNERNFRFHLEKQLNKAFEPSQSEISTENEERNLNKDVNLFKCKERFEALQRLFNNQHFNQFPLPYKSGANGYRQELIQKFNSDVERKQMGLYNFIPGYKEHLINFLKKIWKK